jgi:hypothetical protein
MTIEFSPKRECLLLSAAAVLATGGFLIERSFGVTAAELANVGAAGAIFGGVACGRTLWYALRSGSRFLLVLGGALSGLVCLWVHLLLLASVGCVRRFGQFLPAR